MTIFSGVGAPGTVSSASGGKVYAYNNIDAAGNTVVAPANPSRVSLTFHNPGSNDIFIAPLYVQNTPGFVPTTNANTSLSPTNSTLGGTWRVFANGGSLTITGECQGSWQALAVTGAGAANPLTVMESNV